jgi:hypothetical protein
LIAACSVNLGLLGLWDFAAGRRGTDSTGAEEGVIPVETGASAGPVPGTVFDAVAGGTLSPRSKG